MQHPQKSCSQCRARKTKCDIRLPSCSSCLARGLVCQFGPRQKPGPRKGFRKQDQSRLRKDSNGSDYGSRPHRQRRGAVEVNLSSTFDIQSTSSDEHRFLTPQGTETDYSPVESTTSPDVLQTLESQLIDIYSTIRHFPFLPPACKENLQDPELHGTLRSAFVNALCAIGAHYASEEIFEPLATTRAKAEELYAIRARSAYVGYTRGEEHPTTLTIIKVAAILAFYDLSSSPGIKCWSMVGEAVRLAYDMRLDQLDSKCHLTSSFMSVETAKDARYVWWCIYTLDCYASSTLMRPFAVTNDRINTALVRSHEDPSKGSSDDHMQAIFLPSNLIELQKTALSLDHDDPTNTQILFLLVLSLGRLVANLRREQLDGADNIEVRSNTIENAIASVRLSIPDDFLNSRNRSDDEYLRLTRTEIVMIIELQTLCLYSYPSSKAVLQGYDSSAYILECLGQTKFPGYLGGSRSMSHGSEWDLCVQSAFNIVRIGRTLSSRDCSLMSPTMPAVFWLPAMTLVLYQKSGTSATERADGASGTEVLTALLKRMSSTWSVAQHFYAALVALRADPAPASSELHMRSILQSYSSPLLSVSRGTNVINIPSLAIPFFDQLEGFGLCDL